MERIKLASIEIWNNRMYIMPTLSYLDCIVSNHGNLDVPRYERFRFVVSEILKMRIDNSYPDGRGNITIDFYLTDTYFEVSVKDKGVPGWQNFSYDKSRIAMNQSDFRNFIMDMCTDTVGLEKLGKEGQRIYVRLNIINPINFKRPEPRQEEKALDTNISIKAVTTEEEVVEAIRCIYSEYGYSYAYESLYYVDSFMRMIKKGELMSFLAVNDHGQIAGHFALAFSDLYKNMPEISSVVILKEFRGLGLFSKFIEHCHEIATRQGFRALMGQPVAFHPMSQKAFFKAGFSATALLMSYLGSDLESEYNKNKERLNLCVSVKLMDKSVSGRVYPPKELIPLVEKIYGNIGCKYEIVEKSEVSESTRITIENKDSLAMTRVILYEAADDIEELLKDAVNDTIRRKYEMIELAIVLNNSSCSYAYDIAKKLGFVAHGVIPGGENGDYLIMQILNGDKINYDNLVLVGEFEDLREYIVNLR